jgi:hypothetical protein
MEIQTCVVGVPAFLVEFYHDKNRCDNDLVILTLFTTVGPPICGSLNPAIADNPRDKAPRATQSLLNH